jgi:5-methylcytosine-specific restriction protein A
MRTVRASRICREPGCPNPAGKRGLCDDHRRAYERERSRARRGSDAAERNRFYARKRWRLTARRKRFDNPLCERCGNVATEVHHNPPLAQLLARGLNPYSPDYLVSLCRPCHSAETRREQHDG